MSQFNVQYRVFQIRNILLLIVFITVLIVYNENKRRIAKFSSLVPKDALKYLEFKIAETPRNSSHLSHLRHLIQKYNEKQTILNIETYGPIKRNTIIFVVHVKHLTDSLKFMVASLSEVKGIDEVLLIFSHSLYDENLNEFIREIDFCRVMQIFYPYSVQAYPNTFPGTEPKDCPHDMKIEKAKMSNCSGTPDIRGKYRHPLKSESKLHWWWTANKIFEDLKFSEDYEGIVVVLDDDLYLLEDFLYMVIFMKDAAGSKSSRSDFLSFGTSDLSFTRRAPQEKSFYTITVATWNPQYHSIALAFDASGWFKFVTHYDVFCSVDDYSWSRSLLQISLNMKDNSDRIMAMYPAVPRAYKVSTTRNMLVNNVVLDTVLDVLGMQAAAKAYLFPAIAEIYTEIEMPTMELDALFNMDIQGGWNDPRDKMLCANLTVRKIKKELFESEVEFKQQHLVI